MPSTHFPSISDIGRKSYKCKGSELVWPYELEEALLQGLAAYRPSSKRDPSLLRRFPGRNRWISDFICEKTGKRRSAKQVGSRLQQLRDTCPDTEILGLILNKKFPPSSSRSSKRSSVSGKSSFPSSTASSSTASSSTASSPTSSLSPFIPPPPPKSQSFVQVAVALVMSELDPYYGSPNAAITLDIDVSAFAHRAEIRSSSPICQSPPEIKFRAQSLQDIHHWYRSVTSVYYDNKLVYTDAEHFTFLQLAFFDENRHSSLFSFKLVPEFWRRMTFNPKDYSRYRITQRIISVDASANRPDEQLFSVEYSLEDGAPLSPSEFEPMPSAYYSSFPLAKPLDLQACEGLDISYPQLPTDPAFGMLDILPTDPVEMLDLSYTQLTTDPAYPFPQQLFSFF